MGADVLWSEVVIIHLTFPGKVHTFAPTSMQAWLAPPPRCTWRWSTWSLAGLPWWASRRGIAAPGSSWVAPLPSFPTRCSSSPPSPGSGQPGRPCLPPPSEAPTPSPGSSGQALAGSWAPSEWSVKCQVKWYLPWYLWPCSELDPPVVVDVRWGDQHSSCRPLVVVGWLLPVGGHILHLLQHDGLGCLLLIGLQLE